MVGFTPELLDDSACNFILSVGRLVVAVGTQQPVLSGGVLSDQHMLRELASGRGGHGAPTQSGAAAASTRGPRRSLCGVRRQPPWPVEEGSLRPVARTLRMHELLYCR